MSSYALLPLARLSPATLEQRLQTYLPGLDVRLTPIDGRQLLMRGALVRALDLDYAAQGGAERVLKSIGIARIRLLSDEQALGLMAAREPSLLPARAPAQPVSAQPGVDWHLVAIRAPQAWALLGGPDAIDWRGVRAGHIDTGYTPHPVFGFGQAPWIALHDAATFFPAPPSGEVSVFPDEPGDGLDPLHGAANSGHGTRTGSTICGHAPGAPGGPFHGAAPKLPLVPVRITDSVVINHAQSEFVQAVDHLLGLGDIGVINVSLGIALAVVRDELERAIDRAYEAGVIVVCAAGNFIDPVTAPARLNRTLAVAGVTRDNRPWSGSSFGPEVDFSAPGADLRRADSRRGGGFVYGTGGDGTSYAAALTSGAAALWLCHHRDALAGAYPLPWQRVEAFTTLARATTFKPEGWQPRPFGTGILNVEALLNAPLPPAAALQQQAPA